MDGYSLMYSGETVHYYEENFDLPETVDDADLKVSHTISP